MNTGQRNAYGHTIYRGPRGGEYVLGFGGRKIRTFRRAPAAAAAAPVVAATGPGNKNIHGRTIYRGPRGGEYVIGPTGRKIRTFRRAPAAAVVAAIPPASPAHPPSPRRSSPALLENMMNQIYNGGRGSNINAGRYTMEERNVLARRLGGSIEHFKQQRNKKKAEAEAERTLMRDPRYSNLMKQAFRNRAAAANERVGYYNNAVRAYTRGLRAVKPLTGAVTPRARAMPNTPNRSTPAPANVNMNAIYMPLNRPHLVVKTPGAGTIYLNPNTFTGFMKNAGRVIIAPANVRNWLRMARRNFPNEPLFRHPLAPKNVTASHIRFSRG